MTSEPFTLVKKYHSEQPPDQQIVTQHNHTEHSMVFKVLVLLPILISTLFTNSVD